MLSTAFLLSFSSLQQTTQAKIGWGVSAMFDADDNTTSTNVMAGAGIGATGVAAALYGAKTGAEIGVWGGLAGMAAGAVIGGL